MLEVNVMIAEVSGEVHTEANAHDEVNQGDAVQNNVPDCHEAQATYKSIFQNLYFIQKIKDIIQDERSIADKYVKHETDSSTQ